MRSLSIGNDRINFKMTETLMSKKCNRMNRRDFNKRSGDLRPKEVRLAFGHIDSLRANKNAEEAEDIAKMLDQEVLSDNHFSLIIKEVNSILGRRNKVR
jgi:hypothetical protein